jgi:hypothetical protein
MKIRYAMVALALVLPVSSAWAVTPDPESLPKVSCTDFKYSAQLLARYPKAPVACQDGRIYKGHKYAKFTAKVWLNSKDSTTFQFLDNSGNVAETVTVKPAPGATVTLDGRKRKYSDLKTGEQLVLWIPESRMSVESVPGATAQPMVAPPKKE